MAEKRICIFWSSLTFIQPSHYPGLFDQVKKICEVKPSIELVDVGLFSFEEIRAKAGSCDLVVIDHSIKFCYAIAKNKTNFNFLLRVHHKKEPAFYLEVFDYLFSIGHIPKILMLNCDMHALNSDVTGRFDGLGKDVFEKYISKLQGIIWVYRAEDMKDVEELPLAYRDPFMTIPDGYFPPRQNAMRIKQMVPSIIELPLCVDENEIHQGRRLAYWDVSVIGDGYQTRKIAKANIKAAKGVSLAPYFAANRIRNKITQLLYKSGIAGADKATRFNYFSSHWVQDHILKHSRMSFTCGSGYMYFVRKFFEIPASGSVLLGYTPGFAADYGFIHEQNYLFSTPEEAVSNIRFLKNNPLLRKEIRKKGLALIGEKHTSRKRAEQFIYAIEEFVKTPFKEARFCSGNYTITR
ncbi:MAG: glycosyltransferase [Chitinophagaceae bacterium]